jgi:histidinol phosphatase-like enzyme (inositol monophosphatase family)
MTDLSVDDLLACANAMADAARPVPMRYFRKRLTIEIKDDASPVTMADKETESVLRSVLAEHFPEHGIFGEEHGQHGLDRRHVWVLDPIDGTRSFIAGVPLFGTLIACLEDGIPILGVIDIPALGERYTGIQGQPSRFDGDEIRTATTSRLADALVFPSEHGTPNDAVSRSFECVKRAARETRHGYDCYIYAQLAAGHIDAIIETDLAPYDYLALVPLIEGAGGRITDWKGEDLRLTSRGDVVAAASDALHRELLGLLDPGH